MAQWQARGQATRSDDQSGDVTWVHSFGRPYALPRATGVNAGGDCATMRPTVDLPSPPPVELFFSYSHRDEELRNELEKHLTMLRRQGVIAGWHDRKISAGTEWAGAIDALVNTAGIILLLVSADFLQSEYCYDLEMTRALERQAAGDVRVIPVILRAVDWTGAPFAKLQALPTDGRPVTSWSNRDEAFTDVARGIRKAVTELLPAFSGERRRSDYFLAQRQLIEDHARRFVGRADADGALDEFLKVRPRGYFIVRGGPGQGKTAYSAHLVKSRGYVHHFISRSGGRSDGRLILASLLAQLRRDLGMPSSAAALPELAKLCDESLAHLASSRREPLVIVIDALDELSGGTAEETTFLPVETLPDRVYIVLTSRPNERLDVLQDRLFDVPFEVYGLRPLDSGEIRTLVEQGGRVMPEWHIERLVSASRGNPLYVQTALTVMQSDRSLDTSELPAALDGYYRRATRRLPETSPLHDVLGVLAVARKALTVRELAQIGGHTERATRTAGLDFIREFLWESGDAFTFYHEHFREFVIRELFSEDELCAYHRRIANWLEQPRLKTEEYRLSSLAYHLYESGDRQRLSEAIDAEFLSTKVRRAGYAVLEDVECLTKALLEADDPALVERCVSLVEALRNVVGSDIVDDATDVVQFGGSGLRTRPKAIVSSQVRSIPGVDLYAGLLPKGAISADFVEVAPAAGHLLIAIGDAPSTGIKSAFVARFIANLFASLVRTSSNPRPSELLRAVRHRIIGHRYFEWISMQCVDIDAAGGRVAVANAGHPYPVLYVRRRGQWDCLPVRGELLHAGELSSREPIYQERHAEIAPGDVIVLLSDGLTETSARFHDPFGYRFADVVFQQGARSARQIGQSIIDAWRQHPRAEDWADDVSVVVAVVGLEQRTNVRDYAVT